MKKTNSSRLELYDEFLRGKRVGFEEGLVFSIKILNDALKSYKSFNGNGERVCFWVSRSKKK